MDVAVLSSHDISDSRCRVELQLPLAFAEQVLDCRKVLPVKAYVLFELISASYSTKTLGLYQETCIPSITFEVASRSLVLLDICTKRYRKHFQIPHDDVLQAFSVLLADIFGIGTEPPAAGLTTSFFRS